MSRTRLILLLAGLLLPIAGAAHLLPACPIRTLTGLLCPGCGGTHCLLALLHVDGRAAWAANPLLAVLLPAFAVLAGIDLVRATRQLSPVSVRLARLRPVLWSLTTAVLLFAVLRNLPG